MRFTSCAKKGIHCCDIENAGGGVEDPARLFYF